MKYSLYLKEEGRNTLNVYPVPSYLQVLFRLTLITLLCKMYQFLNFTDKTKGSKKLSNLHTS